MAQPEHDLWAEQVARQLFPGARTLVVSGVQEGVSTWVYRIAKDGTTFYLRILPEENASFAPEVYVHTLLIRSGVHVPEIVYFEHLNERFGRSLVVTTAIAGAPISHNATPEKFAGVLRQAGRELALINQIPVDGFGWVQRDAAATDELRSEYATFAAWMRAEIDQALSIFARCAWFSPIALATLTHQVEQAIQQLGDDRAWLAHGDFDATHIFHRDGEYTGIIDFGEIRGASRFYDLGHFAIENDHLLAALLQGYQEVTSLPVGYESQIRQTALLIAVNRSARRLARHKTIIAADRHLIDRVLSG